MKRKLKFTIAALMIICCVSAMGQNKEEEGNSRGVSVGFTYDNAGNRITRSILKVTELKGDDEEIDSKSGELQNQEETIDNGYQNREIHVYPNPVREELMIDIWNGDERENYHVFLFDSAGKLLKEGKRTGNGSETVDFNSYPLGTYLLIINTNGKKFEYKLIKN